MPGLQPAEQRATLERPGGGENLETAVLEQQADLLGRNVGGGPAREPLERRGVARQDAAVARELDAVQWCLIRSLPARM
jgi:hypothetical protein